MPNAWKIRLPFGRAGPPEDPLPSILDILPFELHIEILSYLTDVEGQISASLTNKRWYDTIAHANRFKSLRYTPARKFKGISIHKSLARAVDGSSIRLVGHVWTSRIVKYKYLLRTLVDREDADFQQTTKNVTSSWVLDEPFFRVDAQPDADDIASPHSTPADSRTPYRVTYTLMRHDGYKTAIGCHWGEFDPATEPMTIRQLTGKIVERCGGIIEYLFPHDWPGERDVAFDVEVDNRRREADDVPGVHFHVTAMAMYTGSFL
ncbi:hypothetical protein TWF696_002618 [Orbilia brochopaga]|uniref:F-box domain-containing protein n=1 Tax=Orbilia brochopaga TaxID=3140254 RepID=A0AAV9U2N7_9PEZI